MARRLRLVGIWIVLALTIMVCLGQSASEEYIVALKQGRKITDIATPFSLKPLRQIRNTSIFLVGIDGDSSTVLKALRMDANVDGAEKNIRTGMSASSGPLDPSLVQQMASLLDGQTRATFYGTSVLQAYIEQPAVYLTRLNEARSLSTGAATQVAYIDTGADYDHPALQPWLAPGVDLVSGRTASELEGLPNSLLNQQMASLLDDRFCFVLDQAMASLLDSNNRSQAFPSAFGHGTLVAGIIHLVAPETRIVPIRAFDAWGNTTTYSIIEGIYRARDLHVDVLNMSFSIDVNSDVLMKAIADAQAAGIALVASVGNDSTDTAQAYPAEYATVVGVAATDFNDQRAAFSNFGRSVAIAAPGAYVISTVPGGKYAAAWGTSFSAPIISGTLALIASGRGFGQALSQTAVTTADFIDNLNPGFEHKLGSGRVNVRRALRGK